MRTFKCFPTSIHEVKLNIDYLDKKQMLQYVQLKGKDDDLHRMSFFRSLADKVLLYTPISPITPLFGLPVLDCDPIYSI